GITMARHYVQMFVEIDAVYAESAALAAERIASAVTRQDWISEPGFVSFALDDRGDGPIVEQNEDEHAHKPHPGRNRDAHTPRPRGCIPDQPRGIDGAGDNAPQYPCAGKRHPEGRQNPR